MFVVLKIMLVLILVVVFLHRRSGIGNALFAGTLVLFLLSSPSSLIAGKAVIGTIQRTGTWEVIIAMYFVMCLEYLLRTSGTLENFMISLRKLFGSDKFMLALMPAFLGFLPSVGGALFSAPMVESSSKAYNLSPERKTAINYWFRHIWEFSNPIVPALILASEISKISLSSLIIHFVGYTLLTAGLGWFILLTGAKFKNESQALSNDIPIPRRATTTEKEGSLRYIILAAGPIFANILLVVIFHLSAAVSMGLVVTAMILILRQRFSNVGKMLKHAFDLKLIWGILNVFLFQQMLSDTGTINGVVSLLKGSGVPIPVMIGILAMVVGLLTGQMQSFVAVAFPVIAVLAPGNINLVTIGYVMGVVGTMLSPAHLCIVLTLEYFQANFIKSLKPIFLMECVVVILVFVLNY